MKQGTYYTNERSYPSCTFSNKLKMAKKIRQCTCAPVHLRNMVCFATKIVVHILNVETLETVKEIHLKKIKGFDSNKINKRNIYLFAYKNLLIIQAAQYLFKYDVENDSLMTLQNNDDISTLSDSVCVNEFLYCTQYTDKGRSIQKIAIASAEMRMVLHLSKEPQFLVASAEKLVYHDDAYIVCYDTSTKKELWKTEIASLADYFDELWKEQKKGRVSAEVFIAGNSVVVSIKSKKIVNLDLSVGKVNWVESFEDLDIPRLTYVTGQDTFFYLANNLGQVDLKTGKTIKKYQLEEALEQKDLAPGPFGISERYLYLASAYNTPGLIVVNRQNGKIEEIHAVDDHCFSQPAIIGNYLTVLDHSGNLYFFSSNQNRKP